MHFLPALTLLLSAAPLASANGGPFTINSTTPGSATPCHPKLVAKSSKTLTSEQSFPHFNATFGPCKVLLGMSGGTLKSDLLRMQKSKPAPNP